MMLLEEMPPRPGCYQNDEIFIAVDLDLPAAISLAECLAKWT